VRTFDPDGAETDGRALADQVWGLGDRAADPVDWDLVEAGLAARQDPQDPKGGVPPAAGAPQDPDEARRLEEERRRAEARLRIAFGDSILINDDGTVTKQYFLSQNAGAVFLNLLVPFGSPAGQKPGVNQRFGGASLDTVLGRLLGAGNEVEVIYIENFEQFENAALRANPTVQAKLDASKAANSLLLVSARPEALSAFERALNQFYANIPQVEIEVKVVEYATSDTIAFGVTPIDANTPLLQNLKSGRLIQQITADFPLSAPLTGSSSTESRGLISLGGIHDSWELNAVLQLLQTNNVADVKSQPRMVVRNGGLATVSTLTAQPFPKARISNQTVTTTDINFQDVGIVMDIRPEIAGTETVVLNIYVSVSAVTGFAATDPVPTPIVSTRQAATSVHLKEGEATVIGGLVSEATVDLETKIPILGDIPILGYLFRSTSNQRSKTTLEFLITPRILVGPRGTLPGGM
jgi:type II secretory pathway component GspD/PulD (secretin)